MSQLIDFEEGYAGDFVASLGLERNMPGTSPATIRWRGLPMSAQAYDNQSLGGGAAGLPPGYIRRNPVPYSDRMRHGDSISSGSIAPALGPMALGNYRIYIRARGIMNLCGFGTVHQTLSGSTYDPPVGMVIALNSSVTQLLLGEALFAGWTYKFPPEVFVDTVQDYVPFPNTKYLALNRLHDAGPHEVKTFYFDRIISCSVRTANLSDLGLGGEFGSMAIAPRGQDSYSSGGAAGEGVGIDIGSTSDFVSGGVPSEIFWSNPGRVNPKSFDPPFDPIITAADIAAAGGSVENCNGIMVKFLGLVPESAPSQMQITDLIQPLESTPP